MSGVLGAMVGSALASAFRVTVGSTNDGPSGETSRGYRASVIGSISPNSFKGATITRAEFYFTAAGFVISFSSAQSMSLISAVTVELNGGVYVRGFNPYAGQIGTATDWLFESLGGAWGASDTGNVRHVILHG
jgi:hypothetical protein